MGFTHPFSRALAVVTTALVLSSFVVAAQPAIADTAPEPTVEATVSSDPLPTVQIDGVVWDQVIVGNTVYVAGNFTTARPAGSAAGVNTVPRTNLLAYTLSTGVLIPSFNHTINGMVKSVAASPDGTRVYIAGIFTQVDGVTRNRVAAFSTATGALVTTWAPSANTAVDSIAATNSTVFVGGNFTSFAGAARVRAAAVTAATGAILPYAPVAEGGRVTSLVISPDASKVVLGGSFTTVNGSGNPGYGLAAVDSATGALLPWNVNSMVRNGGADASIYSLASDGDSVYGSGYHFGGGGTLEGTFRADWANGDVVWIEDCHGDTYSVAPSSTVVYTASHSHYCGNSGGFPQTDPWTMQRAMAWSKSLSGGVNTEDPYGYPDFPGVPTPKLLNWWPDINVGTFTGSSQGAWDVTANDQYALYGGEFTRINNVPQQGLVRFATSDIAPNKDGPRLSSSNFVPSVVSLAAGSVRVAWLSNYDRDNEFLKYDLIRNGVNSAPIYTRVSGSRIWYDRPTMGYLDTGLTPGQAYTYRLRATDPMGNVVYGNPVSVTVSATGTISDYAQSVLADGATSYWRLGEDSGTTAYDWAGFNDAVTGSGITRGAVGPIAGDANTGSTFPGNNTAGSGIVATRTATQGPDSFAVEAWFSTTSATGGKIVGFGNSNTGNSSNYDRHVFMDSAGRVIFGVYPGTSRTIQSAIGFNDGQWHHVVANLGPTGMQLFVDGRRVAQRSDTTYGQPYAGYWRIGGDSSWSGNPYFAGRIDEVAIYDKPLTSQEVNRHLALSGRASTLPTAPADDYGAAVFGSEPDLYWRLGESSGTGAADVMGSTAGLYSGGVTQGASGAVAGTTNTAAAFDGSDDLVSSSTSFSNPQVYSLELWFQSTTNRGGKLIGFGRNQTGNSSSYDRHVYLQDDGRIVFGTWTGQTNTITTSGSYTDGAWHHVVATQSGAGLRLYVDGALQGINPATQAEGYDGYWRVGGDTTWGSSSAYVNARIDEVAVYSTAIGASTVSDHYLLGSGNTPNSPPVAAFGSGVSNLVASVNGSASSDSDGTITSWAWDFGDGGTGSGATASHTYAADGTYSVTLTVTDDDGATDVVTHQVTVAAPPNVLPVAAFTAGTTDLTASVDGSGSTDSDGTIGSWAWTFGDGATATGPTASHAYATAGIYPVVLTVTDNRGGTATATKSVTVTAPVAPGGAYATDSFGRTVSNGLGTAPTGGAWTTSSGAASNFSVDGSTARLRSTAAGAILQANLAAVSSTDTEVQVTVSLAQASSGTGTYLSVIGRRIGTSDYRARLVITASGAVTLQSLRNGVSFQSAVVTGLTYATGDQLRVRLQVFGTSPTTIRSKVWKVGTAEPAAWRLSITDTTAGLQSAGHVGIGTYLSSTSSVLPLFVTFDDLWAGSTTSTPVGPPANVAPTSAFTSTTNGLGVSVDGSGSTDSDGTVASYAWTFGDGGTATGATAAHSYAAAGTYPVTLTVTDDDGATNPSTRSITVTAPAPAGVLAADAFARTVASGWSNADTGGAWTLSSSAANFSVNGGLGRLRGAAAGALVEAHLNTVSSTATDVQVTTSMLQAASGGGNFISVVGRKVGTNNYRTRVVVLPSGVVQLQLQRNGTTLSAVTVAGVTHTLGDQLQVRLQVFGTSPTTLRAKVWKVGQAEPVPWQLSTTDTAAVLQAPGGVGVGTYLASTATVFPVTTTFDNFSVTVPE